jgi:hypothetical protein
LTCALVFTSATLAWALVHIGLGGQLLDGLPETPRVRSISC